MTIADDDIREAMLRKGWIIPATEREVEIAEELDKERFMSERCICGFHNGCPEGGHVECACLCTVVESLNNDRESRESANPETMPHSFSEITQWLEQEQAKQGFTEPETEQDRKGPSEKIPTSSDSRKPLDPKR